MGGNVAETPPVVPMDSSDFVFREAAERPLKQAGNSGGVLETRTIRGFARTSERKLKKGALVPRRGTMPSVVARVLTVLGRKLGGSSDSLIRDCVRVEPLRFAFFQYVVHAEGDDDSDADGGGGALNVKGRFRGPD
jgi:hypothetical protein